MAALLAWVMAAACLPLTPSRAEPASPWRTYRAGDGLRETLTTAVSVGARGDVWARHGEVEAVTVLNGYGARLVPTPGERTYRLAESRAGRVWAAWERGLVEYLNGQWVSHVVAPIQAEYSASAVRQLRPVPILPAEEDRVLVLVSDRLLDYRSRTRELRVLRQASETRLGKFNEMALATDGGVWITGAAGLAKLPGPLRQVSTNTVWTEYLLSPESGITELQRPFEDDAGGVVTVGELRGINRRVIASFDGKEWSSLALPSENVRVAWRGTEPGVIWGITQNGLLRFDTLAEEYQRDPAVSAPIYDVAVQPQGVFWVATPEGLARHAPLCWRAPPGVPRALLAVQAMAQDPAGRLWFATSGGLMSLRGREWHTQPWPATWDAPARTGDGLHRLADGRLVVSMGGQTMLYDPATNRFLPLQHPAGRAVRKVVRQTETLELWVQTTELAGTQTVSRLESYDGLRFQEPTQPGPLPDLGRELFFVRQVGNGDWWAGGSGGLAVWRDGRWQRATSAEGYMDDSAVSLIEMEQGRLWCAGHGRIVEYDGKTWTVVRAGLDRVNDMIRGRDGSVWVATSSGLHRYFKEHWAWVGEEEGLPSSVCYSVMEDRTGRVWAGTPRGLSLYYPKADIEAPRTLQIKVDEYAENSVRVVFQGVDKWRVTPADRLLYAHRLDEREWSGYTAATSVTFTNLAPGDHRFEVRAMDRNWNTELRPAVLDFPVVLPWYQEPRTLSVGVAGLAAAVFFASLAVNRHLRLRRSFAQVEQMVQERTRDLEHATLALAQSQKMTALGTLAAGVAHDFNNILSIIKGSAQIIESNLDDREKIQTRVARIKTMVDQGSGIVRALLGFGRAADKRPTACDVAGLMEETLRLMAERFLKEVEFQSECEPGLPLVLGVKDLMRQMLLNLAINAVEASTGRGRVVVGARRSLAPPPNPVLLPAPSREYVLLYVRDNGSGITPEVLSRIFEPFFTTKAMSTRRGTGLGLYMVYEFAKEMGHGLEVESQPGQGSTFTVILPVADTSPSAEE